MSYLTIIMIIYVMLTIMALFIHNVHTNTMYKYDEKKYKINFVWINSIIRSVISITF